MTRSPGRLLLGACAALALAAAPARAEGPAEGGGVDATARLLRHCLYGASRVHDVPPFVLVMLLRVEGGRLGLRSPNRNRTGDLGPFQVNEIWIPKLASRWGVSRAEAHRLVRDDLCSNTEAAAWILKQALAGAGGDFWTGVGRYHSATPVHQHRYLSKVLSAARELLARASPATGAER